MSNLEIIIEYLYKLILHICIECLPCARHYVTLSSRQAADRVVASYGDVAYCPKDVLLLGPQRHAAPHSGLPSGSRGTFFISNLRASPLCLLWVLVPNSFWAQPGAWSQVSCLLGPPDISHHSHLGCQLSNVGSGL